MRGYLWKLGINYLMKIMKVGNFFRGNLSTKNIFVLKRKYVKFIGWIIDIEA